jgi:hypothetical protein
LRSVIAREQKRDDHSQATFGSRTRRALGIAEASLARANTPIAPPDADGRVYVICSNVAASARRDNRQLIHEKVCTHGEWSFHLSWRQRLPAREVVADDEPQPYILERQSVQADETSN